MEWSEQSAAGEYTAERLALLQQNARHVKANSSNFSGGGAETGFVIKGGFKPAGKAPGEEEEEEEKNKRTNGNDNDEDIRGVWDQAVWSFVILTTTKEPRGGRVRKGLVDCHPLFCNPYRHLFDG